MPSIKSGIGKKRSLSLAHVIVFIIFAIYAASLLFPLFWGVLCSMLTRAQFNMSGAAIKLPTSFNLSNYALAWKELSANGINMITMTINSVWYAAGGAMFSIVFSTMTAYVYAKYRFPGRKIVFALAMVMLMVPVMSSMAPSLRFYRTLHAADSPLFSLFSASAIGTYFIIMNATFKNLSWEYAEAAFIDGAGHFKVFYKVMIPQVFSPMMALFVCEFIGRWNDSMSPLIYMPNMPTLASGLYIYQVVTSRAINYPLLFAALMMCLVPVLILYFIFQESLMDIQLGGGIKG